MRGVGGKSLGSFSNTVAPVKALCSEKHEEWSEKFSPLGMKCQELTGDTDMEDFWLLQKVDIILTTPVRFSLCSTIFYVMLQHLPIKEQ